MIGDATALRMLLGNLVGNAVKYNRPDGEVRLTATANDGSVTLSVSDTGRASLRRTRSTYSRSSSES